MQEENRGSLRPRQHHDLGKCGSWQGAASRSHSRNRKCHYLSFTPAEDESLHKLALPVTAAKQICPCYFLGLCLLQAALLDPQGRVVELEADGPGVTDRVSIMIGSFSLSLQRHVHVYRDAGPELTTGAWWVPHVLSHTA